MDWSQVIDALEVFIGQLLVLIPRVVGGFLIFAIGWAIASLLRKVMVRFFVGMGLDKLSERAKLSELLRKGEINLSLPELIGNLAYWLLIIATVMVALQVIGIAAASEWLVQFGAFLPRIIVSIVVFLFGILFASFLGTTVRAALLNAGFAQGHLIGQVIYTVVLVVTTIVALEQLQVVTRTIEVALYIILATFGLAFGLALGLGAQGLVKRFLEDMVWEKWKSSHKK